SPADAQLTLTKPGEPPVKVSSGVPLGLPTGTYTLSARTADNFVRTATLELTAGQSHNIDLSLAPNGMSKWADPSAWKQENGAFVRKGGDYTLYGVTPTSGTFRKRTTSKFRTRAKRRPSRRLRFMFLPRKLFIRSGKGMPGWFSTG